MKASNIVLKLSYFKLIYLLLKITILKYRFPKFLEKILFFSLVGLSLILIFILSFYNRFAVDDYFHIHNVATNGIWEGMIKGYNNWGGRWTSYLLFNVVYFFYESRFILFIYSLSVIILFIYALHFFIKQLLLFVEKKVNKLSLFSISFLIFLLFFLISPEKGEIWFWVVSTAMYLNSLSIFFILTGLIISKNNKIIHYLLLSICAIYCGGSSEVYAFIFLLIFTSLIIWMIFSKSNLGINFKKQSKNKLGISILLLFSSFLISILAPGNKIRASWLPEPSFVNTLYITFKELIKFIILKLPSHNWWILLFFLPFMHIGYISGKNINKLSFAKFQKNFLYSFIILFIILYIFLFPACYLLSEIGPTRSLSFPIFLITLFIAFWSLTAGYYCIKKAYIIRYGNIISLFILIFVFSILIIKQQEIVSNYAKKLDQRTLFLKKLKKTKNKKTIILEALPSSGFLYSAEISNDTSYFGNEHYRLGLFLEFNIKIK